MQLKRCQTMKRAYEFAVVRAQGSSKAGRFLVLSICPFSRTRTGAHEEQAANDNAAAAHEAETTQQAGSRFGIITTKKLGHAVVRTLLRRRFREILRQHAEPLAQGHYVVIIPRRPAATASFEELSQEFCKLQRRLLQGKRRPADTNAAC